MRDTFLDITKDLSISLSEIRFNFSRSGGKGGQNVNKVESRVELLFDVGDSPSLNDEQRLAIFGALGNRIGGDGTLRIVAQESRSQWKNREFALHKFIAAVRRALQPRKKRVRTK